MSRLTVSLLGPFQASLNSSPLSGFESDRVRALLAYLAVEAGQPHRRDALAALLWPEQPQEIALKNLRHVLYKLRQVLGESDTGTPEGRAPYLLVAAQAVQFNASSDFQLDVTEFTRLTSVCQTHNHRRLQVCGSCHRRLERAAELYRGDFLEGFGLPDSTDFEEWMLMKSEALRREAIQTFVDLAAYSEARGDYLKASGYSRRQLELESWNEEAHRHLMRLLWLTKQRSTAIAQYQACQRVLLEELGIEPSPETKVLYGRILAGDYDKPDGQSGQAHVWQRHNLPAQVTPFIGRDDELARISECLESPDHRLLTLVGPGGSGKSRLAFTAAVEHLGSFEDGVYFVSLAAVTSPDLIVSAIAQAISMYFAGKQEEESQLLDYLTDKEMLLVVDNFEHLLRGASILRRIVEAAPRVSLLVTSRERLNLQAESVVEMTGLSFPAVTGGEQWKGLSVDGVCAYTAVQLFVERARAVDEEFQLTATIAPSVAQICQVVGGLPLAIELAAVHVLDFTCAEIASAIRTNLDFLAADMQDVPQAHGSMRAVFNYSWGLLSEEERDVFRRLSVFRGGWDSVAAERVAGASRPLLAALAGKSLIKRAGQDLAIRYDIHEVLRQYADEQLEAIPGKRALARERHAEYFLALAEEAEPYLRGPDQQTWLERLDQEHANMQAAMRWAAESGQQELGLRLGGALWQFWIMRTHYATGRTLLSNFNLEHAECTPAWAKALFGAGRLAMQLGDLATSQHFMEESMALYRNLGDNAAVRRVMIERARAYVRQGNVACGEEFATEALELARAAGDFQVMSNALIHLSGIISSRGDHKRAGETLKECLRIQRETADLWGIAWTLNNLGTTEQYQGNFERARELYEESLALRREIGDKWGIATCLFGLGSVTSDEGRYEEARRFATEGLAARRELGDTWAISESLIVLGLLEYRDGKYEAAVDRWVEALSLSYAQQGLVLIAYCLTGLAATTLKGGNAGQAMRMAAAATSLLHSSNVRLVPPFVRLYDAIVASGKDLLSDAEWSAAWAEGTTMKLDAAYDMGRGL